MVGDEVRRLGTRHPNPGAKHDAGQPHPGDGRPEQIGIGSTRSQRGDRAVGAEQVHRSDVVAKTPVRVVILPVDVGSDRAANGHLAGPR